jgi:hypothetical protein
MEQSVNEIRYFFKDLSFEEQHHVYYVKGEPLSKSVSKLIKEFVTYTDFKSIALAIDKRDNLPPGTTSLFWKKKSDVALAIGDKAHFFGEMYAFNRKLTPTCGYERAIVKFWNDLPDHIIPVFTELKMWHKLYLFGGMKDITFYNTKTKKFIVGDYKTNADLFKNHKGKTLKKPFTDLLDNAFNHYQIQLSFYQIMFEQTGYEIERRVLIHIKSDGTYDMYDTEDLTKQLDTFLINYYGT